MVKWPWKDRDEKGRFRKKPAGYLSSGQYGDEFSVEQYEGEEEERIFSQRTNLLGDGVVEGEFRELPSDASSVGVGSLEEDPQVASAEGSQDSFSTPFAKPSANVPRTGPTKSRRAAEHELRASEVELSVAEAEKAAKKAQAEMEITRAARAKEELKRARIESRQARVKEIAGYAGKISRVFSPSLGKKEKAELFFGKAKGSLYTPPTPTTEFLQEIPAKQLHKPQLERVRRAGAPASGVTTQIARTVPPPMARQGQSPLNYGFLREVSALRSTGPLGQMATRQLQGGNRLEQLIFGFVQQNQDADTLEHVKSEMEKLGYQRSDTEQALRNLQSQGFIERQGQMVEVKG